MRQEGPAQDSGAAPSALVLAACAFAALRPGRLTAGEQAFKRGIDLEHDFSENRAPYAPFLLSIGRGNEPCAKIGHAIELEPAPTRFPLLPGRILFSRRGNDRTISQLNPTLELDRKLPKAHHGLSNAYREKRNATEGYCRVVQGIDLERPQ